MALRVMQHDQGIGAHICFLHLKGNDEFPISGEGVLIEMVQAPPK
jgi:lactoylglutathione lyase